MLEQETRNNNLAIGWGTFFLFLGIILLLQVTDVLQWRLWGTLWKFWPVLIIIAGLAFIIPRRLGLLMALSSLVIFGAVLGISIGQYSPTLSHDVILIEQKFTYPVDNAERLETRIEFAAGSLTLSELRASPEVLAEIEDGHELQRKNQEKLRTMEVDFTRNNGTAQVDVKPLNRGFWDEWLISWRLGFNPQVPLVMDIRCDGSRANISLEKLLVERLRLEMNVSTGWLTLPASGGDTTIDIDMNVSNLEITVPEGVAVKIRADVNLGLFRIDSNRFPWQGDYYVSPDYDTSENRIELNILCDVSSLRIK